MKKLLTLTLLLASFAASAGLNSDSAANAGFSQLTEAQKAEVIKTIAQQAESNKNSSISSIATGIPDPEGIERWTKIGTSIASGLGAAAKELNVGVNEFAKSPVGQLTTLLIIWKIMGTQLIHIIGAIFVWIIGFLAIKLAADRLEPENIEYSNTDKNIFGNFIIVDRTRRSLGGDSTFGLLVGIAAVIIAGIAVLFSGS
jgi:hypothetical protein